MAPKTESEARAAHHAKITEAGYTWPLNEDGTEPEQDQVHPLAHVPDEISDVA